MLRYGDEALKDGYMKHLNEFCQDLIKKHKVKIEKELSNYPMVVNNEELVKDLSSYFETTDEQLPSKACEDFSEFGKKVKSCFFFYGVGEQCGIIHTGNYNFNDDCIENITNVWAKLMLMRLK